MECTETHMISLWANVNDSFHVNLPILFFVMSLFMNFDATKNGKCGKIYMSEDEK